MEGKKADLKAGTAVLVSGEVDLLAEGGLPVLSTLINSPSTVQQLALRCNLSRARTKFLVDKLMQRGLVRVYVEAQEPRRGEVYYVATVKDVALAVNQDSPEYERIRGAQVIITAMEIDAISALANLSSGKVAMLKLAQCRMQRGRVHAILKQLENIAIEFTESEDRSSLEEFALVVALYPVPDRSSCP
ncbi:MAG: hypothetical protein AB1700_16900 [Bacillota bacterium]